MNKILKNIFMVSFGICFIESSCLQAEIPKQIQPDILEIELNQFGAKIIDNMFKKNNLSIHSTDDFLLVDGQLNKNEISKIRSGLHTYFWELKNLGISIYAYKNGLFIERDINFEEGTVTICCVNSPKGTSLLIEKLP